MNYVKILAILFTILTFVGLFYVLINHGQVNAGYAVVPMIIAIFFLEFFKK